MSITAVLLHVLCAWALCSGVCSAQLVNEKVKRVIDVSSAVAISRSTVIMRNIGDSPVDSFILAVPPSDASSVHDIWVSETSSEALKALAMKSVTDVAGVDGDAKTFKVSFKSPLEPSHTVTVDVRMDVADVIHPVPSELKGRDSQFIRFESDCYFYSPYSTEHSETTVLLGSSTVTSKSNLKKPFSLSGKRLTLGPYEKLSAFSSATFSVRFRHDRGFLVAQRAVKEARVGHWGSIAISEELEVVNAAARHTGEWSRVDYSNPYGTSYGTSIGDVWANLPPDASRVEYRDLIGNITTSRLRQPTASKRAIQLTFRFPLMGGWRNHFWITYDLTHDSHITSSGRSHAFKVPIWPSVNTDLLCEDLVIRIVLPEWADDIKVDTHPSLSFDQSISMERMSLTMFGRQVITLRGRMLRTRSKHESFVVVRYSYNSMLKWVTPTLTGFCLFMTFILMLGFVRSGIDVQEGDFSKVKSL